MPTALSHREPRLLPAASDTDGAVLAVVPEMRAPQPGRRRFEPTATVLALLQHALIIALILYDIRDLIHFPQDETPPTIEVTLVQPPAPPPPPPPPPAQPVAKPTPPPPPAPPPDVPLASDAMAEGENKRLAPAEKAEAAPVAPTPGTTEAPTRKPEPPSTKPSAKPAPAEPKRATTPPPPRATASLPGPQQASPTQKPSPETETALSAPPPERATSERGKAPAEPGTGKAAQTGFATMATDVPGGPLAAAFDAYLAAVRDKIMTRRELLRTFRRSTGRTVVLIVLDAAGRPVNFRTVSYSGSPSFDDTVRTMVAGAPPFGPPPPQLVGGNLYFDLALPDTDADWEHLMATGRPAGSG